MSPYELILGTGAALRLVQTHWNYIILSCLIRPNARAGAVRGPKWNDQKGTTYFLQTQHLTLCSRKQNIGIVI
jgi:hypothetical protein